MEGGYLTCVQGHSQHPIYDSLLSYVLLHSPPRFGTRELRNDVSHRKVMFIWVVVVREFYSTSVQEPWIDHLGSNRAFCHDLFFFGGQPNWGERSVLSEHVSILHTDRTIALCCAS